jgi:hypothetical protein
MSIQSELEKIRAYTVSPSNEAETCHWVIVPLLEACGYARHEINSQNPDGAGRYPDFTILTGTEHQWFLEAKAWSVRLSDDHAHQAIFSAYSTGKKWVVLSNGQDWRLYDASIHAPSPEHRLVARAHIRDEGALERFLAGISKESVASGQITSFAADGRVRQVIHEQLRTKDTPLIQGITEILRRDLGVPSATESAVHAALNITHPVPPPPKPEPTGPILRPTDGDGDKKRPVPPSGDRIHLLTPVKDENGETVEEILNNLLGNGWYVFGERTPYRKSLKPGDKLAFYHSGVGVVAEAEIASELTLGNPPFVKNPARYPWQFRVSNVRMFMDRPIVVSDPALRSRLEAFKGKSNPSSWSWLVQGTSKVSEHDFEILVGRA